MAFPNPAIANDEIVGDGIQSNNYVAGVSGWRIGQDGSAQFAAINILAGTGNMQSGNYVAGVSGWRIAADGSAQFVDIDLIGGVGTQQNSTIQSNDFVEGVSGWDIDMGGGAQFTELNVLDALGAGILSGEQILIGGQDLVSTYLTPPSQGLISFDSGGSNVSTAAIGTAETILFQFAGGSLANARRYRIFWNGHVQGNAVGVAMDMTIRYTVDGSTPTLTSTILRQFRINTGTQPSPNSSTAFEIAAYYSPGADYEQWNMCLTLKTVSASTDTAFIFYGTTRDIRVGIEDLGIDAVATLAGSLVQKSVASGSPGGSTKQTYQKTYSATWSRSFNGNNSIWTNFGTETPDCYQGQYDSTHGNTKSLVGFDYSTIQSNMAGSTVNWIKLKFRVRHAYDNVGLDVVIGSHTYTAKPSTWAGANVNNDLLVASNKQAGTTYTVDITGLGIANGLRDGTIFGIAFGPGPTTGHNYYGYIYGNGSTYEPQLIINYTK